MSTTTRSVILTRTQREEIPTAAARMGLRKFLDAANVRSQATYWRAVAGGPVLPAIAAALVAVADRVRGSQNTNAVA